MTEEVASAVLSGSTKTLEAALEIIRMLAPGAKAFLSKVFNVGKFGVEKIGEGVDKAISKGAISRARLIVEADKARSPILSNSNFLARDAELIAQKAAQYKIPISIVGEGEKQTVTFLERDKDVMSQITQEVMEQRLKGENVAQTAYEFHYLLADQIVKACVKARELSGCEEVALSGGVFQNKLLLKLTDEGLERAGFKVLRHHLIPPNDGGIGLGQAVYAMQYLNDKNNIEESE